jgi:cytochrome P450
MSAHPSPPQLPGLSGLALLRRLPQIRRDTPGFLLDTARTCGGLACFNLPNRPAFFLNSPELIQHVLQDRSSSYSQDTPQYNALSKITGISPLTGAGLHLDTLDEGIAPAVEDMLARWEPLAGTDEPLDVEREMIDLALAIVGKALFSIDPPASVKKLTAAVPAVLEQAAYQARHLFQLPDFLLTPRRARFLGALSTLDLAVYDRISARREGPIGNDGLGLILKARGENGQPMTDVQVRAEVITLLTAGCEAAASALTWSWYLLAQHPAAWEHMRAEVQSVLGGRVPTAADRTALVYTGQVFSEALRLYPPAWLITRRALEPDHYGEHPVPAGALAVISPYALHRTPAYWPDPEAFKPERFAASADAKNELPPFACIPFGGGPRPCAGSGFAAPLAQKVLAMVTQRFRLELIPHRPVVMDAAVTLRPRHGLPMHVRKA